MFVQQKIRHIKDRLRWLGRPRLHRATMVVGLAGALLAAPLAPVMAAPQGQSAASDQQLQTSAQETRGQITHTSESSLDDKKGVLRDYDDALGHSWGWRIHGHKCHTVKKLTHLLDKLERLRQKRPSASVEELYAQVWTLRQNIIMSLPEGKRCGFENVGGEPKTTLRTSDNKQLSFDVSFPQPTLTTMKGAGQTFTQVHMPGLENMVGTPGEPAIPVWRTLIGIPEGAEAKLSQVDHGLGGDMRLNLVPFQEPPVDAPGDNPVDNDTPPEPPMSAFADKPFKINADTYRQNRLFPPNPCTIRPMGQYRDLKMAQLECATAQYNPVSDRYQLFNGFRVQVNFEGGQGNFITSRSLHPFESNHGVVAESVLNKAVIKNYVRHLDISILPCFGEEFLILTHPDFRAAADELASHKQARGMSTSVFNVGSGVAARDTAEEIDDFIEDRYDDCQVRPSYVLLMGDAEFIPTFYPAGQPDNAGSDFPYSNYVQILFDAFFPDFGTGRIPVDTLAQANTVVDKIVNYEASPPHLGFGNGAPFYNTAGLAAQFQGFRMNANGTPLNNQPGTDQRAFVETTELVRDELVDRGYTAPRIYTRTIDNGGYCIQENAAGDCIQTQAPYNGDTTPRRYYNGTLLPAAIGGGSGFAWGGDTADVSAAWNDGRFLFLHRDHGWPGGWGDPGFGNGDIDALSNGDRLPVVFSVNCASGLFDNETAGGTYGTTNNGVYWAERALRKADGGAIGVIGDTRNSPTWANNALTRGFFDAVWPDTVPGHGGNTSHKRLGDILNWGKVYLATQVSAAQTAGSVSVNDMGYEYHIWHVIGDPTLKMWTGNPHKFILDKFFKSELKFNHELVKYAREGAVITKLEVLRDGTIRSIGRGVVGQGGEADLELQAPFDPEARYIYSASLPDAVSVVLEPENGPYPSPTPTPTPSPNPSPSSSPNPSPSPDPGPR